MKNNKILIVSEQSLQSSLLKNQLEEVQDLNVDTVDIDELNVVTRNQSIELVIIDFYYYLRLEQNGQLPDFDVLELSLLIINVPEERLNEICTRWKFLKGILYQAALIEHLPKSVSCILDGGLWLPRHCLEKMITVFRTPGCSSHASLDNLTTRERQILNLMSGGKSNCEIANALFLAESTVKTHIYRIYKKLNIHKRKDALKILKLIRGSGNYN